MYESRKNLPFLTKLNAKPKVSLNPLQSKGAALDPPETLSLDSAGAPSGRARFRGEDII